MERTFTKYAGLPVGEAELKKAGWTKHNAECDPHLGFVWTEDPKGATKRRPLKLYTNAAGKPSGVGVIYLGYDGARPLPEEQEHWRTISPLAPHSVDSGLQVAHVDVAFRSSEEMCSGDGGQAPIGTTLILNPQGDSANSRILPIAEEDAAKEGYRRGSCFDGMGWHWFLDTKNQNGVMSHEAKNLLPIVLMFSRGAINAIFFANVNNQVSIPLIQTNEWEPKALSDSEMCANMCDQDCHFAGTDSWSTLHIYFRDHSEVTCASSLKCGLKWPFRGNCCEKSAADMLV